jgi:hypothetical protein
MNEYTALHPPAASPHLRIGSELTRIGDQTHARRAAFVPVKVLGGGSEVAERHEVVEAVAGEPFVRHACGVGCKGRLGAVLHCRCGRTV